MKKRDYSDAPHGHQVLEIPTKTKAKKKASNGGGKQMKIPLMLRRSREIGRALSDQDIGNPKRPARTDPMPQVEMPFGASKKKKYKI
jgi:hypothetical protein